MGEGRFATQALGIVSCGGQVESITNSITASLTLVERARGFLDAARLSEDWIAAMQDRALIAEGF